MTPAGSPEPPAKTPCHHAEAAGKAAAPGTATQIIRAPSEDRALMRVSSFNGRLRDECLNEHLFATLRHASHLIAAWRDDYNYHRPHSSLDGLTPREYHKRSEEDQTLNSANL